MKSFRVAAILATLVLLLAVTACSPAIPPPPEPEGGSVTIVIAPDGFDCGQYFRARTWRNDRPEAVFVQECQPEFTMRVDSDVEAGATVVIEPGSLPVVVTNGNNDPVTVTEVGMLFTVSPGTEIVAHVVDE